MNHSDPFVKLLTDNSQQECLDKANLTPAISQESISKGSRTVPTVLPSSLVMLGSVPPFFRMSGSFGSSHSRAGPTGHTKPDSGVLISPAHQHDANRPTAASNATGFLGV